MRPRPVVGTCRDCADYGELAYRWLCGACAAWGRNHPSSTCAGCDRDRAVSKQYCRACWKQAAHIAGPLNTRALLHAGDRLPFHQLAFTRLRPKPTPGVHHRPLRPHREQPPNPRAASPGQLLLPLTVLRLRRSRSLSGSPVPALSSTVPHVAQAMDAVNRHAQAHGWPAALTGRAQAVTATVLTATAPGEKVTREALAAHGGSTAALSSALTALGLLAEPADPLPALIARRTKELPAGMARDVAAWMTVLHHGSARTRPKSWKTVREYSRAVRPLLLAWARRHDDLREITSDQVRHQLAAVRHGWARQMTFVAVRSLFGFLRRDGRVFRNPTARLHRGAQPLRPVLPLTAADYARVTALATTPLHRAVLVLVAVHGARPHMVRDMQLTDVDTTRGRLTVAGVPRPLEGVSAKALRDWLHTRRERWPLTANPHLIISRTAALSTAQISPVTLSSLFASSEVSLDRLRMDRYLEEALTYGPDPLHLSSLFGISDATALRYATLARHLTATGDGLTP